MSLKFRRSGASEKTWSTEGLGWSVKARVTDYGYKFILKAEIDYSALTERAAARVAEMLSEAVSVALEDGKEQRERNKPLFDLDDSKVVDQKGVNNPT